VRAQAQLEAAARELLQVPGELRGHQGAARERNGHVGAQLDVPGVLGGHDQGQVGVMARLRRREAVEAQLLAPAGRSGDGPDLGPRLPFARVLVRVRAQDHRLHSERHAPV